MGATSKQIAFANRIVEGMNPAEAYRAAYSCARMSPASVRREAYRLMRNPNVAPLIEQGRREAAENAVWSRGMALERLQAVNNTAYASIERNGLTEPCVLKAFMDSADRLNKMTAAGGEQVGAPVFYFDAARDGAEGDPLAVPDAIALPGGHVIELGVTPAPIPSERKRNDDGI